MRLLEFLDVDTHEVDISRDLARRLDLAAAATYKMAPTDLVNVFHEIEKEFLPRLSWSVELQRETRRRVSQWIFKLLSERNLLLHDIEPLYRAVVDLGFSDLENEAILAIYYARYCVRTSHSEVARNNLRKLCVKLEKALEAEDTDAYRSLKAVAEEIIASLT